MLQMFSGLRRKMDEYNSKFNKEKTQRRTKKELNNTTTEIKNTLQRINSRLYDRKEQTSEPEDRVVEITQEEFMLILSNYSKILKRMECF